MNKRRRIWAVILMAVMLLGYMPGSRTGAFYASAAETVSTESSLAAQRAAGDTAEPPVKNADAASGQSLETDSEKPPEKIEETDSEKTSEKTTEMDSEKESGKSTEAHSENAAEKAAGAAPEKIRWEDYRDEYREGF